MQMLDDVYPGYEYMLLDEMDILNKLTPYGLFKLTPIDNL